MKSLKEFSEIIYKHKANRFSTLGKLAIRKLTNYGHYTANCFSTLGKLAIRKQAYLRTQEVERFNTKTRELIF